MTTRDKVWRYLNGRKRAVTAQHLADYFLQSKSSIIKVLNELKDQDKLEVIVASRPGGGRQPYAWRHKQTRSMAVPELGNTPTESPTPRHATYDRPMGNSYPKIRGYDD